MSSINRVVLVGRLTRDPELAVTPSGASVCNLRLACNGVRKEADGSYREKASFFTVKAFGAGGETLAQHVRKGGRVGIDGRLEWKEWTTAEGEARQAVEVVAERFEFLDGARGEDAAGEGDPGEGDPGVGGLAGEPVEVGAGDGDIPF